MRCSCRNLLYLFTFLFCVNLSMAGSNFDYYNPLDIGLEVGVKNGYTNNLLADETELEDSYTTTSVGLRLYPVSFMELFVYFDYTYYSKMYTLSNRLMGIGTTIIPTRHDSPFSAYLSISFDGRIYDARFISNSRFTDFNNNNFNLLGSVGYQLKPTLSVRSGLSFKATSYLFHETTDRENLDFFAGFNLTFFGKNSFDFEAGISRMNFSYMPDTVTILDVGPRFDKTYEDYHIDGHINSFYFSPRFSRPLGEKIGLNLTFHHRGFYNSDQAVVIGSALNFISPWTGIYEGQSYSFNLKIRFSPRMIVSAGFNHWNKTFLKTHENDLYYVSDAEKRKDKQNRVYFIIEHPLLFKAGNSLKPVVTIDITDNNSSFDNYSYYSVVSVSGGVTYQF